MRGGFLRRENGRVPLTLPFVVWAHAYYVEEMQFRFLSFDFSYTFVFPDPLPCQPTSSHSFAIGFLRNNWKAEN